jgi:predicted transcriptional regulator
MARPASEHPTELELQILKIVWRRWPLPVRDVRDALAKQGRDLAHTSVITTLNTMVHKKYLKRTRQGKAYLYAPRIGQQEVCAGMLGDVVERVFDGSATAVMLALFDRAGLNAEELRDLRKLIDRKMKES